MLDPSLPWLAAGYKNFSNENIPKTYSYDDITKLYHVNNEDFIKKELRSSTPELRQRRRVKSATVHRQLHVHGPVGKERPPRPRTALGVTTVKDPVSRRGSSSTRPGSSQSYCRERVGCYDFTSDHPMPESFIKPKPRPKSAVFLRHRPSSLDRKSVSQVERQFFKERGSSGSSVEEGDNRCAFCPDDCRPGCSSSNRPTSSTGLVAASLSTHFDRYTSWTRPRTAPATKREFQQKPRHNSVNRGRVPHYTNFIKRIELGLKDQTPSPPSPPRARRAFEEPVKPVPPREPREIRQRKQVVPKPEPLQESPAPIEPEEVEEELVAIEETDKTVEEPVLIPSPVDEPPQEEVEPPVEIPSAWTELRAPTPTPIASPRSETAEEERIPTPPPHREPTPLPQEEEPKPITPPPEPEPPKEPTPPPTPPREPTPPPPPPPEPEPPPPTQEPPPKPKKEVRIHDPPVVEPPPRPPSQKKEKKPSNLLKQPSITKKPEPKPEPPPAQTEPRKEPEPEVKEEPEPPLKQVEIPSLPEVKVEEPKPEVIETPEVSKPPEEPSAKDAGQKKKQLGRPPRKVKVDVFGRSMDPEYLLDLEMRSRRRGNQDDDIFVQEDPIPESAMKKSKIESWLKGRMALSKRASRFELPMDMRDLENMTPIAYLERYCIINRRRAALYRRAFSRVDRDCDLKINLKEMEKAIEDALVDTVHTDQIKYVLKLIEAGENIIIRPKLFSAICALLERLFYHEFVTEDTVEIEGNTKERVETADFSALDWKLEGCTVNPPLKKLLYRLL